MTTGRKYGFLPIVILTIPGWALAAETSTNAKSGASESQKSAKANEQKVTGGTAPQASSSIDPKKVEEAARRFERALRLFDSGDNAGALAEFKKIYDMVPQPVVLYNIGLVFAAMSRPVDAADTLARAIDAGGLNPEQLERAKRTYADQQARIGRLTITSNPEVSRIEIDGVEVAQAPLTAPLRVSEGSHIVGAVAEGYAPARKEVLIAGNAEANLNFELTPTQSKQLANITVRSRIVGADVTVDGKPVGKTPLASSVTVSPGHHVVELRRLGYKETKREVDVGPGALGDLSVDLAVDGPSLEMQGAMLVLDSSESPNDLSIDGERLGQYSAPIRLPVGPHHLTVNSPGFLPLDRDVVLDGARSNVVRVVLEPTAETRRNYKSNAQMHRTWGWISVISGAAIAGGSTALAFIESSRRSDAQHQLDALNVKNADGTVAPCDWRNEWAAEGKDNGSLCDSSMSNATSKINSAKSGQTIAYIGMGVGGAVAITGLILLVTGGPPDKYETPARYAASGSRVRPLFSVIPGPGQVGSGIQLSF